MNTVEIPRIGQAVRTIQRIEFNNILPVYSGSVGIVKGLYPDGFHVEWPSRLERGAVIKFHYFGDKTIELLEPHPDRRTHPC